MPDAPDISSKTSYDEICSQATSVYTRTGLTPSELERQRDELRDVLQEIVRITDRDHVTWDRAKDVINAVTHGTRLPESKAAKLQQVVDQLHKAVQWRDVLEQDENRDEEAASKAGEDVAYAIRCCQLLATKTKHDKQLEDEFNNAITSATKDKP